MTGITHYWSRRPVQVKFLVFVVPLTVLLTALGLGLVQWNAGKQAVARGHHQFEEIGKRAAETLDVQFWNYNTTQAKAVVDSLLLVPEVRKVTTVELADGAIQPDSGLQFEGVDPRFETEPEWAMVTAKYPIEHTSDTGVEQLGELTIVYSIGEILANNRAQLRRTLLGSLLIALAVIVGTLVALNALFMKPISAVTKASARGVADGVDAEFEPVEWNTQDQLGVLVSAFNDLRQRQVENTRQLNEDQEILLSRSRELEEMSQLAQEARDEALEANESKSRFLAVMSHELRTPMNAIIGFNRIVMRKCKDLIPEKQFGNLEKVATSANILLSLINGILDLSKIEAGRLDIHLERFDLTQILQSCVRMVDPLIEGKSVAVKVDIPESLHMEKSDQHMIRQITLNLLSNAAKFTETGEIGVRAVQKDDRVLIDVSDTGIGLRPEMLDKIFDEFVQAEEHTTRHYGGTGLGLAIARKMARLLGGDLTVESTLGEGSTFTLDVPVASVIKE